MRTTDSPLSSRIKVGLFTLLGLFTIGALTVYVNKQPYWYMPCQLVKINVDDATGLKTKSKVRSLGLEIGFLRQVHLSETHVQLDICITADVEVLPSTRAYLRGEGFLGDKFIELKPVKYVGEGSTPKSAPKIDVPPAKQSDQHSKSPDIKFIESVSSLFISEAHAEDTPSNTHSSREIPVGSQSQDMQNVVNRVDDMVKEMTNLTTNLKQALNPEEMRATIKQLNKALENASKTLAPEGGLNTTAQRTLSKLEDSIEQLRAVMTRVNKGEGSLGMLLNDPGYAEEIKDILKNANHLLNKVNHVRFNVDIGGELVTAYTDGSRSWFRLGIWPKPDRFYLVGIGLDPRGSRTTVNTKTSVDGGPTTRITEERIEGTGLLVTAMAGQSFFNNRIDLALGALNGDGTLQSVLNFWKSGDERRLQIINDLYFRGGVGADDRIALVIRPFMATYVRVGMESTRPINGAIPYFYGAGVSFDDEDIKLLFALK